jgi:two-component system, NtrC family, nitrogen regulation sensor histidine kinase NtrY
VITRSQRGIDWNRLAQLRRLKKVQNAATLGLVVLGPLLAVATFLVLGPLGSGFTRPSGCVLILLVDLVYVLLVAALVLQKVAGLIAARRARSAGSKLHLRLTGVFAAIALVPTVSVAIFAGLTINVGLEGWFSDRVRQVVGSSLAAAEAYEEEHRRDLTEDALALAAYLDTKPQHVFHGRWRCAPRAGAGADPDPARSARGLCDRRHRRDPCAGRAVLPVRFRETRRDVICAAREGGVQIIEDWDNNEFRALVQLERIRGPLSLCQPRCGR